MAWIESHQSLRAHPKLARLVERLGIPKAQAIGQLHLLWWWALDYARDGVIRGCPPTYVAAIMEWERDPNELIEALIGCGAPGKQGFLERDDEGNLLIHDWDDYAGKLLQRREDHAATMRLWRKSRERKNPEPDDAPTEQPRDSHVEATKLSRDVRTNQPTNQPDDDLVHRSRSSKSSEKGVQGEKPEEPRDSHVTINTNYDDEAAAVYTTYDENIGRLTSIVSQKIGAAIDEFGAARVLEAIKAAALNGARSWSYVEKVLGNEDNRRGPPKKHIKEHYLGGKFGDLIKH